MTVYNNAKKYSDSYSYACVYMCVQNIYKIYSLNLPIVTDETGSRTVLAIPIPILLCYPFILSN
ncbi:hypothetical protein QJS04_geneDACA011880 [Acorus gramineus]|uniref:Uncharacterized protein n=1 Tax=Acorus gramineus TaxID=55184 RepID=A0AAV9AGL9_ACOGR|nr:hypothetical protein QJS04_geneDACA011880 [Acorus gramineus]